MRRKGLRKREDWQAALRGELTFEKTELIGSGRLKKKEDYPYIYEKLADFLVDNLNVALKIFGNGGDETEVVYRLQKFKGMLERILVFRRLEFLKKADKEALEETVATAVKDCLKQISDRVSYESANLQCEYNGIKLLVDAK